MATTGLTVLGPRIPIGSVRIGNQNLYVLPTRELLSFFTQLQTRTGGDGEDVDLIVPPPEIFVTPTGAGGDFASADASEQLMIVSTVQLQDLIREAVALEMTAFAAVPDSPTSLETTPAVPAAVDPMAYETTMGFSND